MTRIKARQNAVELEHDSGLSGNPGMDWYADAVVPRGCARVNAYEAIVNRSNDYITVINRDYVYEIANDAYCRQIGKSRELVIGRTVGDVWGDQRFRDAIKQNLDRCFAGEQVNFVDKFTFGALERHIHVAYYPYGKNGVVTHALVFSHDITRLSEVENRLTNYEVRDPVTGLFNRSSMEIILDKEIEQARGSRSQRLRSLIFISTENLGRIVDLYGHEVGDLLLENTGLRIMRTLATGDFVFRFDGNELAVLITSIKDRMELATTAIRIHQEISVPYHHGGATLVVGAAVGIAIYPDDGKTRDEVVRNAHFAMTDAKRRRQPYVFYDADLHREATNRLSLGAELANALNSQQFALYFQPLVNPEGEILGAEALIRWHHPVRGLVQPKDIIPNAVDTGLIVQMGRWVLFNACEHVARWSAERELFVTINLTASEFLEEHLPESVARAIVRSGIRPSQLKLEITETESMERPEAAVERIELLQQTGVDVLIDDFGTGNSSLTYLRSLPARILKLDQAFAADVTDQAAGQEFLAHIIRAIKSLGKLVVLEGIGSAAQAQAAARLECDLMQGMFYGRASPAPEFERMLARNQLSTT